MLRRSQVPWLVAALGMALVVPAGISDASVRPRAAAPDAPGRTVTVPGWKLQTSKTATQGGATLSAPTYDDSSWTSVPARSTVMGGLVAAGKYGDLNYSTNLTNVDKSAFSVPWWYRETFTADPAAGTHTFLRLDNGVIGGSEIWLNGTRIGATDTGAYPAHEFDVTGVLKAGANALAIKASPAALVNTGLSARSGLSVQTTIFNADGTVKSDTTQSNVTAKGNGSTTLDKVATPSGLSTTYFVRLLLKDASGAVVDRNVYWLSTKADTMNYDKSTWYDTPQTGYADLSGLQNLGAGKVDVSASTTTSGDRSTTSVKLTNSGSKVAFFLRATIRKGASGGELAPVTWSDDYVTIWPGESVTLQAGYRTAELAGATPNVQVAGVNVAARTVTAGPR
jgi:archaellum component FlaF (FlaF/FlaG flagellin family)